MFKLLLKCLLFGGLLLGPVTQARPWNPLKFSRPIKILAAINISVAMYDVQNTLQCYPITCYERDPLARPFVGHPTLDYGLAISEGYGLAVWAQHLKEGRYHRLFWVPQVAGMGLHLLAIKRGSI